MIYVAVLKRDKGTALIFIFGVLLYLALDMLITVFLIKLLGFPGQYFFTFKNLSNGLEVFVHFFNGALREEIDRYIALGVVAFLLTCVARRNVTPRFFFVLGIADGFVERVSAYFIRGVNYDHIVHFVGGLSSILMHGFLSLGAYYVIYNKKTLKSLYTVFFMFAFFVIIHSCYNTVSSLVPNILESENVKIPVFYISTLILIVRITILLLLAYFVIKILVKSDKSNHKN